ncbi:unnamed protein product, partial [Coregonus sp. 'balchen']
QEVGMEGPLVDAEGFPRADVNVYQIRTARHSLQNDHKAIMVEIEEALHRLHALEKAKREQDQAESQTESMEQEVTLPSPFARVDAVSQGSPACQAGLRVSDEIIAFGSINTGNFQNLQNIASVVQHKTIKRYSDSKWPEDPNGPYPTAVVRQRFTGMQHCAHPQMIRTM